MSDLLIPIMLISIAVGALIACLPRNGKNAWFVGKPFLEPAGSVIILAIGLMGLVLIVGYFTTIDDVTLSGGVTQAESIK